MVVDWATSDDILQKMAAENASAAEIATAIAGATRNAVIGRARRLGLQLRGSEARAAAKQLAAAVVAARRDGFGRAPAIAERKRPFQPRAPIIGEVAKPRAAFAAPAAARPMLTLKTFGECRWPFDDEDGVARLACGAATDKVYCRAHAQLAYTKPVGPAPRPARPGARPNW